MSQTPLSTQKDRNNSEPTIAEYPEPGAWNGADWFSGLESQRAKRWFRSSDWKFAHKRTSQQKTTNISWEEFKSIWFFVVFLCGCLFEGGTHCVYFRYILPVSTPWVLTDLVHHGVHAAGKASGTYGTSLAVPWQNFEAPKKDGNTGCFFFLGGCWVEIIYTLYVYESYLCKIRT